MGRISTRHPTTVFGEWLFAELEHRGWERKTLAVKSGVGITTINQIIAGVRNPSREMVTRLVAALPKPIPGERASNTLLDKGLQAAGFAPVLPRDALLPPAAALVRDKLAGISEDVELTEAQMDALIDDLEKFAEFSVAREAQKQSK